MPKRKKAKISQQKFKKVGLGRKLEARRTKLKIGGLPAPMPTRR